jgi:acyl dehydratase
MALCDGDADRFGHLGVRFPKPVYPGDTLDTHVWRNEHGAVFRTVTEGSRVVLDHATFRFRPAAAAGAPKSRQTDR